jgi:hypothetical protein
MFDVVPREALRGWSAGARSRRLLELLAEQERLHAEIVKTAGEWNAQADWAVDGAVSPRCWLAHRAPVTKHQASRLISQARLCRGHEATGAAVATGAMSCAHLDVLAPMIRGREPEYARCERDLLDAASTLRADDFAVVAHHWRQAADDELAQLDAAAMADRVALYVSKTMGGMGTVTGDLDPDGTATLLEALDLAAPPDSGEGPEPPRFRRAAARPRVGRYLRGVPRGEGKGRQGRHRTQRDDGPRDRCRPRSARSAADSLRALTSRPDRGGHRGAACV